MWPWLNWSIVIVIAICYNLEHLGLKNSGKGVRAIWDRIGLWKCWFLKRGETWVHGEEPLGASERTKTKLNPHMVSALGFEPRPRLWEGALTPLSAPPLLPNVVNDWKVLWNMLDAWQRKTLLKTIERQHLKNTIPEPLSWLTATIFLKL